MVRAATFGAVGKDVEGEIGAAVSGSLDEIELSANEGLRLFEGEKKEREQFRNELFQLKSALDQLQPGEVGQSTEGEQEAKRPRGNIVIVIDELDPCRADYALNFLEDAKHLFDVEGYIFVLFVDEAVLGAAANRVFGEVDGGEGYLRKFIDYKFYVPDGDKTALAKHAMAKSFAGIAWPTAEFLPNFIEQFSDLLGRSALSPRQIEQAIKHFEIAVRARPKLESNSNPALAIGGTEGP